ncbi:MAG: DUF4867 family protein [Lachnospiraceae bacterium]|nr:DUF4867 family protein [Lachnospiraceae bacterium]
MEIKSVYDPAFKTYGRIMEAQGTAEIAAALMALTPLPEGTEYVAEDPALQELPAAKKLAPSLFGGLPVEFGWCNGHNSKLNCLEYHRSSEFNLGAEDFILILARQQDLDEKNCLPTEKCEAFYVPAGVLVEVYATSLHYAPCHADPAKGFKTMVALPKGTNLEAPECGAAAEDRLLRAANKWLVAHPEAPEAKDGAFAGLKGVNIDLKDELPVELDDLAAHMYDGGRM